jgi:hypothetical protein
MGHGMAGPRAEAHDQIGALHAQAACRRKLRSHGTDLNGLIQVCMAQARRSGLVASSCTVRASALAASKLACACQPAARAACVRLSAAQPRET